ncbi:FecR family protein [Brevundimonas sp. TWP2-3-2]|uniref:FecR family protein n=1 Tax=unclassified Brevundimonas TaxID=2622653 RepID=UPI003CF707C6
MIAIPDDQDPAEEALVWFAALRDEDAPEAVWLAFQDWLEADPSHGLAYDDAESLWSTLDGVGQPTAANAPGPSSVPLAVSYPRSRRSVVYPAIAAAFAGLLGLGLWFQFMPMGSEVIYTADEAPRSVVLGDGSHVELNRHSTIGVRLNGRARQVHLKDGEAAFDVVHDASRPFVVSSADQRRVEVLGTAFNVVSHDHHFRVDVARGLVAVTGSGGFGLIRVPAGQGFEQVSDSRPRLLRIDPSHASDWRQGVLVYRDSDIQSVAFDLSRYFDKPVRVSPSAASLSFTGALRIDDEATMLAQLEGFVPVRVQRTASEIRLTVRDGG